MVWWSIGSKILELTTFKKKIIIIHKLQGMHFKLLVAHPFLVHSPIQYNTGCAQTRAAINSDRSLPCPCSMLGNLLKPLQHHS